MLAGWPGVVQTPVRRRPMMAAASPSRGALERLALVLQSGAIAVFIVLAFWRWPKIEVLAGPDQHLSDPSAYLLPPSAYRVEWDLADVPPVFRAGVPATARIGVRNLSSSRWPAYPMIRTYPPGAYCIRLSYRFLDAAGRAVVVDYDARINLPRVVGPNETATVVFPLAPPKKPGHYVLQFDLCQEMVTWFEWMGAAKGLLPVQVQP
jgi:hypothetical protein